MEPPIRIIDLLVKIIAILEPEGFDGVRRYSETANQLPRIRQGHDFDFTDRPTSIEIIWPI